MTSSHEAPFDQQALARHANDRVNGSAFLEAGLQDLIARELGVSTATVDIDRDLGHLGLDLLAAQNLQTEIETRFALCIPLVRLLDAATISKLAIQIMDHHGGQTAHGF